MQNGLGGTMSGLPVFRLHPRRKQNQRDIRIMLKKPGKAPRRNKTNDPLIHLFGYISRSPDRLKLQMFDRLPFVNQFLKGINADAQVHVQIFLSDLPVAFGGLYAAGSHRLIGDE
jgi:hypothetical protein